MPYNIHQEKSPSPNVPQSFSFWSIGRRELKFRIDNGGASFE
jgi:hypothetical protein